MLLMFSQKWLSISSAGVCSQSLSMHVQKLISVRKDAGQVQKLISISTFKSHLTFALHLLGQPKQCWRATLASILLVWFDVWMILVRVIMPFTWAKLGHYSTLLI